MGFLEESFECGDPMYEDLVVENDQLRDELTLYKDLMIILLRSYQVKNDEMHY